MIEALTGGFLLGIKISTAFWTFTVITCFLAAFVKAFFPGVKAPKISVPTVPKSWPRSH